jgi:hypothetical protein
VVVGVGKRKESEGIGGKGKEGEGRAVNGREGGVYGAERRRTQALCVHSRFLSDENSWHFIVDTVDRILEIAI